MSNNTISFVINISGDANSVVQGITQSAETMNDTLSHTINVFDSWKGGLVVAQQLSQMVQSLNESFKNAIQPGVDLNTSMQDLSAITGVTGAGLKKIEGYARETARAFGIDAAGAAESYKLILSQLSPEIAKNPQAMKDMGESIAVLSKTMGGDATAAAEVLTTAMNQYGVSLQDPTLASKKMAEMMNAMAAAGKEGSAELPQIKEALEQCGMAAKGANVSFEETNAAIQVLDKAGKKGAEGGVALRNAIAIMSQGRFMDKSVREELNAAGIDVEQLGNKSMSLSDRLRLLQPVMQDDALFVKLFGRENVNAAMALVQGVDEIDRYKGAITGTNTAYEQAQIVMESYAEKQARVKAKFDDIKISVFNATGDLGTWIQTIGSAMVPVSQLVPLMSGFGRGIKSAASFMNLMNTQVAAGSILNLGFMKNIVQSTFAIIRFATVGLVNAIKGVVNYIASLVTGGAASATFAGVASASFATFATTAKVACTAVGTAIKSIPVLGWIIAIVSAIGALFAYFWNTSVRFRATMKGLWASVVAVFKGVKDLAVNVFGSIGDLVKAAFSLDGEGIKTAITKLKSGFSDFGKATGDAFNKAYDEEMQKSKQQDGKKEGGVQNTVQQPVDGRYTSAHTPFKSETESASNKGANVSPESNSFLITTDGTDNSVSHNSISLISPYEKMAKTVVESINSRTVSEESKQPVANTVISDVKTPMFVNISEKRSIEDRNVLGNLIESVGGDKSTENKPSRSCNIVIEKLIEKFEIHTTNLTEDLSKVKELVADALCEAVDDLNIAS